MSLLTRAMARTGRLKFAAGTSVAGGMYGVLSGNSSSSSSSAAPYRSNLVACDTGKLEIGGMDLSKLLSGDALKKPEWINADTMQPLAGGLTFGGASGLAAGVACKKIGKAVAVGVGGLYCLFQVAASYGYITVNWKKVEKDVMTAIDTNGDGKVDEKDVGVWMQKALSVLSNEEDKGIATKNSATGGFLGGFLYGLRLG